VVLALLALIAMSLPLHAEEPPARDKWMFSVRPYLWVPSISGTLKYSIPPGSGGGGPTVDLSSYILQNLNFALMVSADARKGDWAVLTDLVYLDIKSDDSTVKSVGFSGPGGRVEVSAAADVGTELRLTGFEWELAGAYTVAHYGKSSLEVLAGMRYLGIEAKTDWSLSASVTGPGPGQSFANSGGVSDRVDLWDGIVGIRGAVALGSGKWGIPYYVDVGTGSSAFTWQGMTGIEYRFHWGELQLVYRHLYYDMKEGELLQSVSFSGPALGARFHF